MEYVSNAFSLGMVEMPTEGEAFVGYTVSVMPADSFSVRHALEGGAVSVVGHADTAAVFSEQLGIEVPFNRQSVILHPGDVLYVGQYKGPRLPEGCKALPEGASIQWLCVEVRE